MSHVAVSTHIDVAVGRCQQLLQGLAVGPDAILDILLGDAGLPRVADDQLVEAAHPLRLLQLLTAANQQMRTSVGGLDQENQIYH